MSIQQKCKVEGCTGSGRLYKNGNMYFTKGLCSKHYQRLKNNGNLKLKYREQEKHGLSNHPLYHTWADMRDRCNNPKKQDYAYYGGRGIKVCEQWESSFKIFLNDMGEKPSSNHSIDRIDNDGDYTPENCRWTTRNYQGLNRRTNRSNTSGYKGVSLFKQTGKWRAYITFNSKRINLGFYDSPEQAWEVRRKVESEILKDA